jgi:hypothetical protein
MDTTNMLSNANSSNQTNRTGNYCAFYVPEPFNPSALRAHAVADFCHYDKLREWKDLDETFLFNDSHHQAYNVRGHGDWEMTLKPRIRERLRNAKNIILFLSSRTNATRALIEELDYGINNQGLPVIVIYPDFDRQESMLTTSGTLNHFARDLWESIPIFAESMDNVPTLHIPLKMSLIRKVLSSPHYTIDTKLDPGVYRIPVKVKD